MKMAVDEARQKMERSRGQIKGCAAVKGEMGVAMYIATQRDGAEVDHTFCQLGDEWRI